MYQGNIDGKYAYHQSSRGGGRTPPVQVGEELDVTIEAVGEKGDGIAKKNGFVLFIPGVKEGERLKVRVTKVLSKVGFAEKIGEADTKAPAAPSREDAEEVLEAPGDQESSYEDTENFGEEPAEVEEPTEVEETVEETEDLVEEEPADSEESGNEE